MLTIPKGKICVTPIFDSDTTPSGLYIPEIARERCDQGIVKYIGADVGNINLGDYVLFSGYSGTLIALEGEGNIIILSAKDVRCKLHPPGTFIAGLYYKYKDGDGWSYALASYEDVIAMTAQSFSNDKFFQNTRITNQIDDKDIVGAENHNAY